MRGNIGKVVAVAVVAFTVGIVHTFIKPHLDNLVPASWKTQWYAQAFFTGSFILVALIVSATALRAFKVPGVKAVV